MWPCSSAEPEPADFKLLDGDLFPLLLDLERSLVDAGDRRAMAGAATAFSTSANYQAAMLAQH